jgi:hypothetical protein
LHEILYFIPNTAFLVGLCHTLDHYELESAMQSVFGPKNTPRCRELLDAFDIQEIVAKCTNHSDCLPHSVVPAFDGLEVFLGDTYERVSANCN